MPGLLRTYTPLLFLLLALLFEPAADGQGTNAGATSAQQAWEAEQARLREGNRAEYANMLHQLGLSPEQMRPGADGSGKGPHSVNYDEAKVPTFTLPDPLRLHDGRPVQTAGQWWSQRRPELVADLQETMYGRVPAHTPAVTWTEKEISSTSDIETKTSSGLEIKLQGHVDNTHDPAINVDIQVELTLPPHAKGPVPVLIALDWPPSFWADFARRTGHALPPAVGPTAKEQVLARGWGYALLVPTSVQPDNGAGLTSGIIGLCNGGAHRLPDQWGALRAWAWGASRLLDYLQTQTQVDAHRIGIFGHSRYGKAALVAMAFDPRFAIAYVSSSGEAGAKLSRREYGELLENVASDGEYHWMAGNFLRYASTLQAKDLPVDAHDLVALCAPRAVFLSAGTAAAGDGWVDAKGIFLAAEAASPVYQLLGVPGLGTSTLPTVRTEVGEGPLAFRQHDGGHTPMPNWPAFLDFAQRELFGSDFPANLQAQ